MLSVFIVFHDDRIVLLLWWAWLSCIIINGFIELLKERAGMVKPLGQMCDFGVHRSKNLMA